MTLYELIRYLRIDILNDDGGNSAEVSDSSGNLVPGWVLNDETCLWSNVTLTHFANLAEREYLKRIPIISRDVPSVCQIQLFVGQNRYLLNPVVQFVLRAYTDRHLKKVARSESPQVSNGTVREFMQDGRYFMVYPSPIVDIMAHLTVGRYALNQMSWATRATDVPEVPVADHPHLAYWMAYLCYQKAGSDTFNPGMSAQYKAMFDSAVGGPINDRARNFRDSTAGMNVRVRPW